MRLLIVDDEKLTREGLLSSVDWDSLKIDEIIQADDGINGLKMAQMYKPDIVLCDVKMPRLTGIEMVEKLETILPDTSIIFMSGYSDKEYLKAAIKLKAISYVEKPLNPAEILEAVSEAIETHNRKIRSHESENLYSIEKASKLALLFTKPYKDNKVEINELAKSINLKASYCSYVTYVVKLRTSDPDSKTLEDINNSLKEFLNQFHMTAISISTHAYYHVYHILGNSSLSKTTVNLIDNMMHKLFSTFKYYAVTRGEVVSSVSKIYQSYVSACALMQNSFFYKNGILLSKTDNMKIKTISTIDKIKVLHDYIDALSQKDKNASIKVLDILYDYYYQNMTIQDNNAKDIYYKLLETLHQQCQKLNLSLDYEKKKTIIEYVQNCFTYEELHSILKNKNDQLFKALDNYEPEDSTIFLIKDYISKNYFNETLSIKEISDHVFLTASYVCTYFKNQTGQTLNQYITDYRIDIAKQLLSDPRYQIADISSKVGYSNGNYFGKTFKKQTGLSPSKYREKILS